MKYKGLAINIIFFFAIIISLMATQHLTRPTTNVSQNLSNTPDAFMTNATFCRMDETGHEDLIIVSPHILHYKEQNCSLILKPHITVYKNDKRWLITSEHGQSLNGTKILHLQNNVRIKQLATQTNPACLLTTRALTILPKANLIMSKEFVTIEQPGFNICGTGLKGDLNTGNVQLLSKTRGQYNAKQLQ